ncbi:MAG: SusC/RagA family TonB-linked outer membrane protein [Bacteroidales bacterium]|nr:SusC/RagA family TonB-linked outer membrane protein [Bacteroidales bacterium]
MRKLSLLLTFLFFVAFQAAAQNQITGKVTNAESGDPIPGVSIVVKGQTTIGTTTDMDGNYSLQVPSDAQTLVFTFVGMQKLEEPINGRTTINVQMEPAVEEMEEVVVLGYSERGRNKVTGSSVQVNAEELEDVPSESVDQSLQGKVAGVNVRTNSGTPGAVQDIRIRGRNSLTAGNEPLWVIDGVPVTSGDVSNTGAYTSLNKLASLSSDDIKSVTVLKDASATAAYGARGSNGVIVVETKGGQEGQKVDFTATTTLGFRNKAVEGREPLSGQQRFTLYQEAIHNSFGVPEDEAWETAKTYGLAGVDQYQNWIDLGKPDISWEDALANKNAPITKFNLSASGGTDVSSFYASLNYNVTEATVVGAQFERYSGMLNYTRDLSENLSLDTKLSISNSRQNPVIEQSAYFASPIAAKYFTPNVVRPRTDEGKPNLDYPATFFNPLYLVKNDINYHDMTTARGYMALDWDITDNLRFDSKIHGEYSILNAFGYGNRNHGDYQAQGGNVSDELERTLNYTIQNSLTYNFSFMESHHFDVKVLQEFQKDKSRMLGGYGENFPADGLIYLDNAPSNQETWGSYYDWMNLSYLGLVNYNYQGKYVVDLSYRREGSSRFAEGYRFGDFWSAGVAWNITEESFMQGQNLFSNLRLRASYGTSGNSQIGLNQYQALLNYNAKYNESPAAYPAQLRNRALSWEKNRNLDAGIDFGFFEDRLTGSVAYFDKETYDLLQSVPLTRTSGFSSYQENVGAMVNKGFEFELSADIIRSQDMNWSVSGHFSTVENEVTELATDPTGGELNIQNYAKKVAIGHPAWGWYLRDYAGVNDEGFATWYKTSDREEVTTNYSMADKMWNGGSALPTYSGGFSTHFDYKGLFLDVNVMYSGGNKILERWAEYYLSSNYIPTALYQGMEELMDRWQEPGDEETTDVPKVKYAYDYSSEPSTRLLYDGDFVRVKGITLGYNVPEDLIGQFNLEGLRIYARASNYFTWVKDDGLKYDPEVRANGYTRLTTPPVKSLTFGANLKF